MTQLTLSQWGSPSIHPNSHTLHACAEECWTAIVCSFLPGCSAGLRAGMCTSALLPQHKKTHRSDFSEVTLCCPTLPKWWGFYLLALQDMFSVLFSLLEFILTALRKTARSLINTCLNHYRQSVDDSSTYFGLHTSFVLLLIC